MQSEPLARSSSMMKSSLVARSNPLMQSGAFGSLQSHDAIAIDGSLNQNDAIVLSGYQPCALSRFTKLRAIFVLVPFCLARFTRLGLV